MRQLLRGPPPDRRPRRRPVRRHDPQLDVHTDSLQLYGARNTVIRGNHFHDFDMAIMAPDGGTNEVIADNVFVGGGYRPAIQLGSHAGSQFVHNTVRNIDVHMDRKTENPGNPSRDGVIRDNVFVNGTIGGYSSNTSYCSSCRFSYNLFSTSGAAKGTNAIVGTPVFAGGANPTTYAGRALASGSPGKGTASDGTDRGIRIAGGPAPEPTPEPAPEPTPEPTPKPPADTPARALWTAPAGAQVGRAVTLDASAAQGDAPLSCTWSFENADGSIVWETATGCTIQKTFRIPDTKYVELTVRDANGDTDALRLSFPVTTAAEPADTPARAVWTAPSDARTGIPVTLDGTRSEGDAPLACTWSFENPDGSTRETRTGCLIATADRRVGTKYVTLTVRDADGDGDAARQAFHVGSP